jgi:hypothetical protein
MPAEEAEHLARTAMLDVDLFDWFKVSRALNACADGSEVSVPVAEPPAEPPQLELL